MKKPLLLITLLISMGCRLWAQCSPQGDQVSYGTNNVWIGYVYDNMDFTGYAGYVNEGTTGNPNFDQSFGGSDVNYPTNGCSVFTSTFSVRYRLTKTFSAGGYEFTVGADDGYRLSLDGGATWLIDRWGDQSYNISTASIILNGTYNMVLEFYENAGDNRISFAVSPTCMGPENTADYGTNDTWRGYVYDGTNFNIYKGVILRGTAGYASFDESFGGSNVMFPTSACDVQTETFSVRFRLRKNFPSGNYTFVIGGDDGYRLSIDGGNTWIINRWYDQSFTTASQNVNLNGLTDLVLEYYENSGDNRISFQLQANIILKVDLLSFGVTSTGQQQLLKWELSGESDPSRIDIERSADGARFATLESIAGAAGISANGRIHYQYTDAVPVNGQAFYRLRMYDRQGVTSYSPIVKTGGAAVGTPRIFPSLVTGGALYMQSPQRLYDLQVLVLSMDGRTLHRLQWPVVEKEQLVTLLTQTGHLKPGMYLVQASAGGTPVFQARFLKQ